MGMIQVAIMTVGERYPWVKSHLLPQLPPGTIVSTDVKRNNVWLACKRTMLSAITKGDYILILQDDIELCPDFFEIVNKTVKANPNEIISYFCSNTVPLSKRTNHWIKMNRISTAQANLYPSAIVPGMLLWIQKYIADAWRPHYDDQRIMNWQRATGTDCWQVFPELVEHDHIFPSTMPTRQVKRWRSMAHFSQFNLKEIDWTLPAKPVYYDVDFGSGQIVV